MNHSAYQLHEPETRLGSVVFASPHSGRRYPWAFLERSVLDERAIRSSEDAFVDLLFADVPAFGAPLLLAQAPRAYLDLNRADDELDPALVQGVARHQMNPRVASGLGVVPRVVSNGRAIYRGKIPRAEAEMRIARIWHPYHAALGDLLATSRVCFGEAILIDCHSMPHEAIGAIRTQTGARPDVVLGDRFGAAAAGNIVDEIEATFADAGLSVARNTPFAGAFIARHYGRPSLGQHVVQVELDRALYMNERQIRPNGNFEALRGLLRAIIPRIIAIGQAKGQLVAE